MPPLFFPPKPNRAVIGVTHQWGAFLARWLYKLTLQISQEDLAQLRTLSDQRVIYLVNHPSFNDPIPVMLLSAKLRKSFYYLGSVEQFSGLLGRYLQRIGGYSVRRGQRDRPSMRQTLALLSQPQTHLVFFPEGGCSFQNDTVMPFRPGAIQLGFQAMQRESKQGHGISDCYIVPLALKYRYVKAMEPSIRKLLGDLEGRLALSSSTGRSEYERLRAIAVQVMDNISREYRFEPPVHTFPLDVGRLRLQILGACEAALGIQPNERARVRERTYQVEAALSDGTTEPMGMSGALIKRSVFRLFNFNAIYDGYIAEKPTAERFLDTLTRLEREVFEIDRPQAKGDRIAQIVVGDVFNLKDYYQAYAADRSSTVNHLTITTQQSVQHQLDSLTAEAEILSFDGLM